MYYLQQIKYLIITQYWFKVSQTQKLTIYSYNFHSHCLQHECGRDARAHEYCHELPNQKTSSFRERKNTHTISPEPVKYPSLSNMNSWCRLNKLENVLVLQGETYIPVHGAPGAAQIPRVTGYASIFTV